MGPSFNVMALQSAFPFGSFKTGQGWGVLRLTQSSVQIPIRRELVTVLDAGEATKNQPDGSLHRWLSVKSGCKGHGELEGCWHQPALLFEIPE